MRRRLTTSPLRIWSRRLPRLAAAAILALGTSRAGAQQAQLGAPVPMGTYIPPAIPASPTPVPTTLPALPNYGASQLQPSSLQSRSVAAATPKVADQRPIQTQPMIPASGAPQPSMAELRQSLRDDGLKNMGMPEFTRQIGARPPTPPAAMLPAKTTSSWPTFFARSPDTTTATPRTTTPVPPSFTENAPAPRSSPPVVQQTSGTVPAPVPEQQSWWYRLTHRTTPSDNASPQPSGPMVLPEATPLRLQ